MKNRRGATGVSSGVVEISEGGVRLPGTLTLPEHASGIVVFAHGSGSSRLSPRNLSVAETLHDRGFGTLMFDLLTPDEAANRENVFAVDLLARRLSAATRWVEQRETASTPIGYFGASTGAAAALQAAPEFAGKVVAIVSRGGRPDMAGSRLPDVGAPTLLIVGGEDHVVLDLNRQALAELRCHKDLVIVPGATHLFEEPGALEQVAQHAARWFERFMTRQEVMPHADL